MYVKFEPGGPGPGQSVKLLLSQIEVFWGARPRPSNEQHAERPGPSNLQRVAGPRALVKVVSNVSFVCGPVLVKSRVESSGDGAFVKRSELYCTSLRQVICIWCNDTGTVLY